MPIALAVNGVKFEVPCSVDPTLSLHEYLRVNTPFKVICRRCSPLLYATCAMLRMARIAYTALQHKVLCWQEQPAVAKCCC